MFDHLTLPNYAAIRSFVTKWLQESLLRGDLQRLLQPLLTFVLAPNTKRIGVVHAHMLRHSEMQPSLAVADIWYNPEAARHGRRSMPDLDADDLNIIAVSTENGNVAYQRLAATTTTNTSNNSKGGKRHGHQQQQQDQSRPRAVNGNANGGGVGGGSSSLSSKQKRSPIRTIQKRIFGVSLMSSGTSNNGGGNSGKCTNLNRDGNNNSMASAGNNISVIINPMEASSTPSLSPPVLETEEAVRIKLHAGKEEVVNHLVEGEEEDGQPRLSSSAPTGAVNFLVSAEANGTVPEADKQREEEAGYDDDDEMDDEEEMSAEKEVDEAADMSLLETNNNNSDDDEDGEVDEEEDEDESSWHPQGELNGRPHGDEGGRSSCDSMKVCSEGEANSNRFVGDVNFIGDVMSEHDRTKNKKNYSLEGLKMKASQVRQKAGALMKDSKKAEKKAKKQRLSGTSKGSSDSGDSKSGKSNYRFSDPTGVATVVTTTTSEGGMDELLLRNNINWEKSKRNVEVLRENNRRKLKFFDKIHPLHSHMLLFYGVYDTKRVLHCLRTLRNLLANEPRTFLCLTMTTSVADSNVKGLLIR